MLWLNIKHVYYLPLNGISETIITFIRILDDLTYLIFSFLKAYDIGFGKFIER